MLFLMRWCTSLSVSSFSSSSCLILVSAAVRSVMSIIVCIRNGFLSTMIIRPEARPVRLSPDFVVTVSSRSEKKPCSRMSRLDSRSISASIRPIAMAFLPIRSSREKPYCLTNVSLTSVKQDFRMSMMMMGWELFLNKAANLASLSTRIRSVSFSFVTSRAKHTMPWIPPSTWIGTELTEMMMTVESVFRKRSSLLQLSPLRVRSTMAVASGISSSTINDTQAFPSQSA